MSIQILKLVRARALEDLSECVPKGRYKGLSPELKGAFGISAYLAYQIQEAEIDSMVGIEVLGTGGPGEHLTDKQRLAAEILLHLGFYRTIVLARQADFGPQYAGWDKKPPQEHLAQLRRAVPPNYLQHLGFAAIGDDDLAIVDERGDSDQGGGIGDDPRTPKPLTTADIAFSFSGLRGKTEEEWKKLLGKKRDWTEQCVVQAGTRGIGGAPKLWNPVLVGNALVDSGKVQARSVRGRFQSQPLLKPWLEEWKTHEAAHFDTS
jgi:hypothetical protein